MTDNIIVLGDMNAYGAEDAITAFSDPSNISEDYINAIDNESVTLRPFSYLFDGQWGSLDYAFVSTKSIESMEVKDAKIWNINSPEPDLHDYRLRYGRNNEIFDSTKPYRFSDHDPILLSLGFNCGDSPFRSDNGHTCASIKIAENKEELCEEFGKYCVKTCDQCPTTAAPSTVAPTTAAPTTAAPTTAAPSPFPTTAAPITAAPTTAAPTTAAPSPFPTTAAPSPFPTTAAPSPFRITAAPSAFRTINCKNDRTHMFQGKIACKYIRKNPRKRCDKVPDSKKYCPKICKRKCGGRTYLNNWKKN